MGVRCHRDIKPDNILITSDHILKITDFGIAGILGAAVEEPGVGLVVERTDWFVAVDDGRRWLRYPTHMPPEQFVDPAMCDERSDIYSFGIVLYQMRTGGKCPFPPTSAEGRFKGGSGKCLESDARFTHGRSRANTEFAPLPRNRALPSEGTTQPISELPRITFRTRAHAQAADRRIIAAPELKDHEAWEWNNKAASLKQLGRYEEAILCCEKALDIDPECANFWYNKGLTLHELGRPEKALACYSTAVEIDPQFAAAWYFKGKALGSLGHYEEAVACFSKALEIDRETPLLGTSRATHCMHWADPRRLSPATRKL